MTKNAITGHKKSLAQLEVIIERGLSIFVEVGAALLQIRDSRLYRETYATFEDYCRQRWGWSRRYGNMIIAAAQVTKLLGTTVPIPATERQARELTPLLDRPEEMRKVWVETVAEGEPTAARVREKVTSRLAVHFSSEADEWETPQDFFDVLNSEFQFTTDVCSLPSSAKCRRYFSPEDDGLSKPWTGRCWMNPPYGDEIQKWIRKAAFESAKDRTTIVACLLPARVDTSWWWDYCRFAEVRFMRGRLKFGTAPSAAPFPSAVVIFGCPQRVVWWEWQRMRSESSLSLRGSQAMKRS
jgi:phage N-6-adenine-methyltransferase